MTIEEVKQVIENSKFEPELKQRLILTLPSLGKYTLVGLGSEVSRGDSLIIADYLVSLWENFARYLEGLKNNNAGYLINLPVFLKKNLNRFNGEDELYFLNFVLDIRPLAGGVGGGVLTSDYFNLLEFEIRMFWKLPKEEVLFILENELLFLEKQTNPLQIVKVATWENEWDLEKDFSKTFSDSLFQNKEALGGRVVGDWVQQYFNFSSPSSFRNNVMQVAEYLIKDPKVKKLSENEKRILSEILKLYVWFFKSEMNREEVYDYKEQLIESRPQDIDLTIPETFIQQEVDVVSPPIAPAPKSLPIQKPMPEVVEIPKAKSIEGDIKNNGTFASDRSKVQTIIKKKESNFRPGLTMGDGSGQKVTLPQVPVSEENLTSTKSSSNSQPESKPEILKQSPDIDKKLEELEKRIKPVK